MTMSYAKREACEQIRRARVHISGLGHIGTWLALHLACAGVGLVSANDPQSLDQENIGAHPFALPCDLGKAKVYVLEEFFHGRQGFVFEPLVTPTESRSIDPFIGQAHLVISCANTVEARLATERKAIEHGKPVMQVAAFDGRERLGGLVALRLPKNDWSACFGCYLSGSHAFPRGELLLATVTGTLAAVAASIALQLLSGSYFDTLREHNLFLIDLASYQIEALAVERRKNCMVCWGK